MKQQLQKNILIKAYIIIAPCSGKTFFVRNARFEHEFLFVDQDDLTSKWIRTGDLHPGNTENTKANALLSYLNAQKNNTCLFGAYLPMYPNKINNIAIACVILPKYIHMFFLFKRCLRRMLLGIYHGTLFSNRRKLLGKWESWEEITKYRQKVLKFASHNNIPVFKNIQQAILWVEDIYPDLELD